MLNKLRSKQGFTLIELLIVVAIIGILAAIAIPQFASYRTRGFNAAANSDVRNVGTAEEALFADSQGYGTIVSAVLAPAVATLASAVVTGPLNGATAAVAGVQVQNVSSSIPFSLSNGVSMVSKHTVTAAPVSPLTVPLAGMGISYVVVSKHLKGDACFGRDSDGTSMFKAKGTTELGLLVADVPASVAATALVSGIDLTGTTGACATWQIQ